MSATVPSATAAAPAPWATTRRWPRAAMVRFRRRPLRRRERAAIGTARRCRTALAVLTVAAAMPAAAFAAPGRVSLHMVSGPTPFPAGCPGAAFDATMIPGQELEPSIAVNRARPRNVVAAWIQDVGPDSSRTDLTASSHDGGRTWTRHTIPGLTKCEGGPADSAADPWLSSGGDGTVYFAGLAPVFAGNTPQQAIVASHSIDGGRTWAIPATLVPPTEGNETPAITASPTRRGQGAARHPRQPDPPGARLRGLGRVRDPGLALLEDERPRRDVGAADPPRPARAGRLRPLATTRRPARPDAPDGLRARRVRRRAGQDLRHALARRRTHVVAAGGDLRAGAREVLRPRNR